MTKKERKSMDSKVALLMDHYTKATGDMDTRRTRKNGWNAIIDAYMGILPKNWPYTSKVTDPRIRTTIIEKTARLLNSKLQGRLIPREGGDIVKARIQNALLDYQWDAANNGGAMQEKVAKADQIARLFGASFVYVYWDNEKDSNELKVCDPRDILVDFAATHIRDAKWLQYREFTTLDQLEKKGFDVAKLRKDINFDDDQEVPSTQRSNKYEDQVKINRGLEDKTGMDEANPVIELVTEWTTEKMVAFLPQYAYILKESDNPYDHGSIPFAMLRYYPLGDDIYGESEVESVLPLQRAINATLCGFIDEMNLSMRPPLKIKNAAGLRIETIEYGPGARWILGQDGDAAEAAIGGNAVQQFNVTYPALVAAFNTNMGDQSLGVSNVKGSATDKTATEVISLEKQQTTRDQYNQLYLAEFLKDIMMMWLSNNKQYLFDDPSKKFEILKIVGKDQIQALSTVGLDSTDIPHPVMGEIADTITQAPDAVTPQMISQVAQDASLPNNPVITNPEEENPENYDVVPKLNVSDNGDEADLYIEKGDLDGLYDYVPDVKSMAAGAGIMQQQAREKFLETALNPVVQQMLTTSGQMLDIKEILTSGAEDAGYKDAESLFKPVEQAQPGGAIPMGGVPGAPQAVQQPGVPGVPQAVPPQPSPVGLPPAQGLPNQGGINPSVYGSGGGY